MLYSADVINHGQEYSESAAAVTINIEGVSLEQILQEILHFEGRMKLALPGGSIRLIVIRLALCSCSLTMAPSSLFPPCAIGRGTYLPHITPWN